MVPTALTAPPFSLQTGTYTPCHVLITGRSAPLCSGSGSGLPSLLGMLAPPAENGFQKPSSACWAHSGPSCWALTGTAQRHTQAHPTIVQFHCSLCTWELVLASPFPSDPQRPPCISLPRKQGLQRTARTTGPVSPPAAPAPPPPWLSCHPGSMQGQPERPEGLCCLSLWGLFL